MKKILCVTLSVMICLCATVSFAFDDVKEGHWAKEYIDALAKTGVIEGYEDLTFRPENNVTRAEFAKILSLCFKLDSKEVEFEDVNNHWAKEYIEKCKGIIPSDEKMFSPDTNAKRWEIASALSDVLGLRPFEKTLDKMYSDFETVPEEYRPKVASASETGIIEGYENGEIRGDLPVTRAEICALVTRALDHKEKDDGQGKEDVDSPPVSDKEEADKENQESDKDGNIAGLEHIYTLVPAKNLLLVTSSRETRDEKTGDRAVRLTYVLSGDDEEFSSVLLESSEIDVLGARDSLFDIEKGDILMIDSGFLRHIDRIFVLSSLGEDINQGKNVYIPNGSKIGEKGSDRKYELIAGKIDSKKSRDKAVVVTLDNGEIVSIPRSVDINIYHPMLKLPWESASPTAISTEESVLFARYTDGVVTDAVVAIYER